MQLATKLRGIGYTASDYRRIRGDTIGELR